LRNATEDLYILKSSNCTVDGNTMAGAGSAEIYMKHAQNNTIRNNSVSANPIQVRGDSSGNVFTNNGLTGDGFKLEAYDDLVLGCTYPHDNQVSNGSILNASVCFVFSGAYNNLATQVEANGCTPQVDSASCGRDATGNTVQLIPAP